MSRPVYLTAAAYRCAQGSDTAANVFTGGLKAETAQMRTSRILDQTCDLPYFNAFGPALLRSSEINALLADTAERTAAAAGWSADALDGTPVLFGSTAYVMSEYEACRSEAPNGSGSRYTICETPARLAGHFGHAGAAGFATSCTSSGQAVVYAARLIAAGFAEQVLVAGFENFNRYTFENFRAMHLLAETADNGIFNGSRGMVLGEAAACLALSARAPEYGGFAEIKGIASQTDNQDLTNGSPDALHRLIEGSLNAAGLHHRRLCGVKVHGSGAPSDDTEAAVLARLLPDTPAILFKPYTGHTLGATAALETALLAQCLQQGALPPLPNPAPRLPLPSAHGRSLPAGAYLNYFLGFGGSHCAWILDWQPETRKAA